MNIFVLLLCIRQEVREQEGWDSTLFLVITAWMSYNGEVEFKDTKNGALTVSSRIMVIGGATTDFDPLGKDVDSTYDSTSDSESEDLSSRIVR